MFVQAAWDEEAFVWTVVDSDVPGLVCEANSVVELEAKLMMIVPDLLSENKGLDRNNFDVEFRLVLGKTLRVWQRPAPRPPDA